MNNEKKVFLNTFYLSIGKIVTSGLGVVSFGVLAHYFDVEHMGEYNLVLNFVSFLTILADFGLGTVLLRDIAAKKADNTLISYVFGLRLLLSIIFIGFGSLSIFIFPYSEEVKIGVIIYAIVNIFSMLSALIWSVFQAKFLFSKVVVAQITIAVINTVLLVSAAYFHLPFLSFIFATSIGMVVGFFVSKSFLHKKIQYLFDKKRMIGIANESWPLGAGVLASVIFFKIDSLILPYFYNPNQFPDVGYYGISYKIFEVLMVFGGLYTQTLFPLFSAHRSKAEFKRDFRKYIFYTFIIAVIGNIGLFFLAKPFLYFLGGEKYYPAIPSLQILSFALTVSILSGFFLNIGVVGHKQFLLFKFAVIAAIINIGLNLILIPKYSFIGASWVTVVTQLIIFLTSLYSAVLVIKERKFVTIEQ
ncbi:MAG TPA: flippase [Candidatus Acidoferrales bacterium]|nr:flippase [Candidatus Acidoferrales bacterium]